MIVKGQQQLVGVGLLIGTDLEPGIDVRTDEPGPNRSLMVGGVTGPEIAVILGLVIRVTRSQGAQPIGRQQLVANRAKDGWPAIAIQYRIVERNREKLIGPARDDVRRTFAVDYVVQVAALFIPKAFIKRLASLLGLHTPVIGLGPAISFS